MPGGTVDAVQFLIKGGFDTAVHFIVPGIGEAFQFKGHRAKAAECSDSAGIILQGNRPDLMVSVVGHKEPPGTTDFLTGRFHSGIANAMTAAVILHLRPHRTCADVPNLAAFLVPEENVPRIIVIDHAHIGFFVQIIASAVTHLGNLGAVAFFAPQIVKPVSGRFRIEYLAAHTSIYKTVHLFFHRFT